LFVAGCGRLFEGSPAQMHHSLCNVLAALPEDTRLYCGHEYTVQNLRFAATVEPDNAAIRNKLEWALEQTEQGQPTVPSTLRDEQATNPFLRAAVPAVAQRYGNGTPVEVFAAIRRAKDHF
ncbi:MAG: hydroxyacylglutathione hydrolase, partial [Deltaproteobacteria bacterium]